MTLSARAATLALFALATGVPLSASAHGDAGAAPACIPADKCCRVCSSSKACGNACITASKTCHKGRGCACNEAELCETAPPGPQSAR
ncbi:MAG: hypothetical protein R3B36_15125 [Polyangiaceae bacterium]